VLARLDIAAACDRLAAERAGLGPEPLGQVLIVDLDTPGDPAGLVPGLLLPAVTVGVSRLAAASAPLDVLFTVAADPAAPWVQVADLDQAIEEVVAAIAANPQAAVILMHVLRAGRHDDLEHDLVVESLAYSALQSGPEHGAWLARRPAKHRPPDPGPPIIAERRGARLSVTLSRPHVRNAYNAAMRDALCETLTIAAADETVTEVELRGAGSDFCSGGDLDEFGTRPDPASAHLVRTGRSAARLVAAVGDRASVHLHGACVGAGIELPALAARVSAAPNTIIRLPEVAMGLIPGAGGTASLPRRIGRGRTAWLALTGQPIDAETALRWGLVDHISDG
jgi:enoyl-CoA hydratase/carnithine racemase